MKDYPQIAKEYASGYRALREDMEETVAGFGALAGAAMKDGALDHKTKELIGLALAVSARCEACIATHAKTVFRAGASREDVIETIGVAIFMGGGPATVYGIEALRAYDQYAKAGGGG